ncbi:hypothetical protein ACFQ5M_08580 [Agrilactobacillus yilanensis]|uniref:SHOCT domain-containing protein n=1 Tax=Agrilactobacillus yilanensis TaxID=2485997 RepID=A0ABW4J881_9LACO|nr:hypothetical protein [Agrilactobacillus yilanensis]
MHCMVTLQQGFFILPNFFAVLSFIALGLFLWVVMTRLQRQRVQTHQADLQRMLSLLDDAYHDGRINKETYLRQRTLLLKNNK